MKLAMPIPVYEEYPKQVERYKDKTHPKRSAAIIGSAHVVAREQPELCSNSAHFSN
jgi:hypothetical protein